jgi:hypothetical protein
MKVDYSDRAITLRIERLGQLRTLCIELKKAGQKTQKK